MQTKIAIYILNPLKMLTFCFIYSVWVSTEHIYDYNAYVGAEMRIKSCPWVVVV